MVFQPGQSGNPGGRPKREWTWSSLIAEEMEKVLTAKDGTKDKTKNFVAKRLVKMAIDGDIMAQKEIMNRMDGNPTQHTDITTQGRPLPILSNLNVISSNNSDQKDKLLE